MEAIYKRNELDDVLVKEPKDDTLPMMAKFMNEEGVYSEEQEISDKSDIAVNTALYGKEITQEEYENA